jgi:transcriptional regulator GlxA family with amidase domain
MEQTRVTVLVLDGASLSSLAAAVDVFGGAGVTWNQIHGRAAQPRFRVELVTADGRPAVCSGLAVTPDRAMEDVSETDLVFISALMGLPGGPTLRRAVRWLRRQHSRGAQIAAPCTAAFVLAETGLLDGRWASTHWAQVAEFRERFPGVELAAKQLLEDGSATFNQIASDVSYEHPSSFRRLFIRYTGLSPSVYRSRFAIRAVDARAGLGMKGGPR